MNSKALVDFLRELFFLFDQIKYFDFRGLVPRWLLEIATIVISNMVVYLLKTQLPTQGDMLPLYEYMGSVNFSFQIPSVLQYRFESLLFCLAFCTNGNVPISGYFNGDGD